MNSEKFENCKSSIKSIKKKSVHFVDLNNETELMEISVCHKTPIDNINNTRRRSSLSKINEMLSSMKLNNSTQQIEETNNIEFNNLILKDISAELVNYVIKNAVRIVAMDIK